MGGVERNLARDGTTLSVCIVGGGVRGLGVLERLIAWAGQSPRGPELDVHIFDECGSTPPQYDVGLPDYLLLNIVCGEVSLFPDCSSVRGAAPMSGPSLYQWAADRNLRIAEDGFTVGDVGRSVEPGDFLPRRIYGEYMMWFLGLLRSALPPRMRLHEHHVRVETVLPVGSSFRVLAADGLELAADFMFLVLGQLAPPPMSAASIQQHRTIEEPYPLPDVLNLVDMSETVAVRGFGLTAVDAVLALTVGRGGHFADVEGVHRYVPSGFEPHVVMYSRSGLPFRSRPVLSGSISYDAVVFRPETIDAIRGDNARKVDFTLDVLPLLWTEMRVAYRRAQAIHSEGPDAGEKLLMHLREAEERGEILRELDCLDAELGEFDAAGAYFAGFDTGPLGADPLASSDTYGSWWRNWLAWDFELACLGTGGSPEKAAIEACREFRDGIRRAVDFGGLTDASLDDFFGVHAGLINRLVVGPQKERTADLIALFDSGVLSVPVGPDPTVAWDVGAHSFVLRSTHLASVATVSADWHYLGVTRRLVDLTEDDGLIGDLADRGVVRRFRPASTVIGAIDVDERSNAIGAVGAPNDRLFIMGLAVEGATFYNSYVTSPGRFVRSQWDADRAAERIFTTIDGMLSEEM